MPPRKKVRENSSSKPKMRNGFTQSSGFETFSKRGGKTYKFNRPAESSSSSSDDEPLSRLLSRPKLSKPVKKRKVKINRSDDWETVVAKRFEEDVCTNRSLNEINSGPFVQCQATVSYPGNTILENQDVTLRDPVVLVDENEQIMDKTVIINAPDNRSFEAFANQPSNPYRSLQMESENDSSSVTFANQQSFLHRQMKKRKCGEMSNENCNNHCELEPIEPPVNNALSINIEPLQNDQLLTNQKFSEQTTVSNMTSSLMDSDNFAPSDLDERLMINSVSNRSYSELLMSELEIAQGVPETFSASSDVENTKNMSKTTSDTMENFGSTQQRLNTNSDSGFGSGLADEIPKTKSLTDDTKKSCVVRKKSKVPKYRKLYTRRTLLYYLQDNQQENRKNQNRRSLLTRKQYTNSLSECSSSDFTELNRSHLPEHGSPHLSEPSGSRLSEPGSSHLNMADPMIRSDGSCSTTELPLIPDDLSSSLKSSTTVLSGSSVGCKTGTLMLDSNSLITFGKAKKVLKTKTWRKGTRSLPPRKCAQKSLNEIKPSTGTDGKNESLLPALEQNLNINDNTQKYVNSSLLASSNNGPGTEGKNDSLLSDVEQNLEINASTAECSSSSSVRSVDIVQSSFKKKRKQLVSSSHTKPVEKRNVSKTYKMNAKKQMIASSDGCFDVVREKTDQNCSSEIMSRKVRNKTTHKTDSASATAVFQPVARETIVNNRSSSYNVYDEQMSRSCNPGFNRMVSMATSNGVNSAGMANVQKNKSDNNVWSAAFERFCENDYNRNVPQSLDPEYVPEYDPLYDCPPKVSARVPAKLPMRVPRILPAGIPHASQTVPTELPTHVPQRLSEGIPRASSTVSTELSICAQSTLSKSVSHASSTVSTEVPTFAGSRLSESVPHASSIVPTELPTHVPSRLSKNVPHASSIVPTELPTHVPSRLSKSVQPASSIVPTELPTHVPSKLCADVPLASPTNVSSQFSTNVAHKLPSDIWTRQNSTGIRSKPASVPQKKLCSIRSQLPTRVPKRKTSALHKIKPSVGPSRSKRSVGVCCRKELKTLPSTKRTVGYCLVRNRFERFNSWRISTVMKILRDMKLIKIESRRLKRNLKQVLKLKESANRKKVGSKVSLVIAEGESRSDLNTSLNQGQSIQNVSTNVEANQILAQQMQVRALDYMRIETVQNIKTPAEQIRTTVLGNIGIRNYWNEGDSQGTGSSQSIQVPAQQNQPACLKNGGMKSVPNMQGDPRSNRPEFGENEKRMMSQKIQDNVPLQQPQNTFFENGDIEITQNADFQNISTRLLEKSGIETGTENKLYCPDTSDVVLSPSYLESADTDTEKSMSPTTFGPSPSHLEFVDADTESSMSSTTFGPCPSHLESADADTENSMLSTTFGPCPSHLESADADTEKSMSSTTFGPCPSHPEYADADTENSMSFTAFGPSLSNLESADANTENSTSSTTFGPFPSHLESADANTEKSMMSTTSGPSPSHLESADADIENSMSSATFGPRPSHLQSDDADTESSTFGDWYSDKLKKSSSQKQSTTTKANRKLMKNTASRKQSSVVLKRSRGVGGWEESLRQKPRKTEHFQVNPYIKDKDKAEKKQEVSTSGEINSENKPAPVCGDDSKKWSRKDQNLDPNKKSSDTDGDVASSCPQPAQENISGRLVWAKFGNRWWPGLTVLGCLAGMKTADIGKHWVFWFGDHKISQISKDKIVPFIANYCKVLENKMGKMYRKAVVEAVKIFASRCGKQVSNTETSHNDLLEWADNGFEEPVSDAADQSTGSPVSNEQGHPLPGYVIDELNKIADKMQDTDDDSEVECKTRDVHRESGSELVRTKQKKMNDICISCDDGSKDVVSQHPLFCGGLCKECKEELKETLCAIGDDGSSVFCVICSAGGELFVCDNEDCLRAYCIECVEVFINGSAVSKIRNTSPWLCFLCNAYTESTHGLVEARSDWEQKIIKFFDTGYRVQEPDLSYLNMQVKRPIRVLSLFDGIGTGKLVLSELGLDVDKYYSCEIDEDALLVMSVNHGSDIIHLGDVARLTQSELQKMCPIDLIIGGSPCNDLSLANPTRKGFEFGGSGMLFFEFYRILETVQSLSANHHVFWMFENVASMKHEYREVISRFLGCDPVLWDAKYFSAQSRPRYFWGNIPGMYSTPQLSQITKAVHLETMLSPHCNRKAVVDRLRTVTTRQNSLKIGKNDDRFPITMNGKDDMIWISELERIFGFPVHYTDVGNLPMTRRQKLLGKSWSVPVVKQILSPLKKYFSCKTNEQRLQ